MFLVVKLCKVNGIKTKEMWFFLAVYCYVVFRLSVVCMRCQQRKRLMAGECRVLFFTGWIKLAVL